MKPTTLAYLAFFAALLAYVLLVEKKRAFEPGKPPSEAVFQVTPDEIQSLEIAGKKEHLRLERRGEKAWELTAPLADRADPGQVDDFLRSLADLKSIQQISREENLKAYGLDMDQAQSLKAGLKSGAPLEIRVGNETPTREGHYAYVPGANPKKGEIVVIPGLLAQSLKKTPEMWRDKAALHFETDKVERIQVEKAPSGMMLEKRGDLWELASPIHARADETKVMSLLTSLQELRASRFDQGDVPHPMLTIRVWEKGDKNPNVVRVGSALRDGYPAQTEGRAAALVLPLQSIRPLLETPQAFRDRPLLAIKEDEISRVDVAKGKTQYTFEKSGGNWKVTQPGKSTVEAWKGGIIVSDVKGLEEAELPKPQALKPQAVVTLWKKDGMVAKVAIGEKSSSGKSDAYRIEINPGRRLTWGKAELLLKDIP